MFCWVNTAIHSLAMSSNVYLKVTFAFEYHYSTISFVNLGDTPWKKTKNKLSFSSIFFSRSNMCRCFSLPVLQVPSGETSVFQSISLSAQNIYFKIRKTEVTDLLVWKCSSGDSEITSKSMFAQNWHFWPLTLFIFVWSSHNTLNPQTHHFFFSTYYYRFLYHFPHPLNQEHIDS